MKKNKSNPMTILVENCTKEVLVLQLVACSKFVIMMDKIFYSIIKEKKMGVFYDIVKTYRAGEKMIKHKFNSDMSQVDRYNKIMNTICQVMAHDTKGITVGNWQKYLANGDFDIDYEMVRQIARLGLAMGMEDSLDSHPTVDSFKQWSQKHQTDEHSAHTLKKQLTFYIQMVVESCKMVQETEYAPMYDGVDREGLEAYLLREHGITLNQKGDA